MINDLQAEFLPRFTALARTRLAHALEAVGRRDYEGTATAVRELHALAGEAGLLGLATIVPLARDGEDKAKQLGAARTDGAAEILVGALRALEREVEAVAASVPAPADRSA